ncbi:hypothetical protein QSH39_011025 [Xanthomonas arboricola pv. corylina]|uniref:hypothetical protein n=1 Tax=Xanthomonas arboricola TaxID=56448 RepID=UPI000CEE47CC|nr:hypothetical protein [Xanthomonas arboricola]MDN0203179.1 hypothetical protein [Xanthomonas arboricola pv. corylina]MDN0206914.1 hypothetical protein [Xanthomonas arboricola pv. corylina]MDN0211181.1 hypothetical protein [Xanthomonas arboricola pv. corylina]MDN0216168.1 hypothetical protein [Xanthomonas arboricola pv. corylina]PPU61505.1 hypothetical protein XacyCFBP1159_08350 [Xanthomonas arboricola pv. corylina]
MLLIPFALGAGPLGPVAGHTHGVVRASRYAPCVRFRQYVAFQRLALHRAAPHRMVVPICR